MTPETKLTFEIIVVAAGVAVVLVAAMKVMPSRRPLGWLLVVAVTTPALAMIGARSLATARHAISTDVLRAHVPHRADRRDAGYVSSDACRACHPAAYASWHASYHRTMTQHASPGAVLGDFDGVTLAHRGQPIHLERRGDEYWADIVDPDWTLRVTAQGADPSAVPDAPRVQRRVVMTTGSHHYQAYWLPSVHGNMLINFPLAYLREDERWVPREAVFLRPPDAPALRQQWNTVCIDCHAVAGERGLDPISNVLDSSVAELGIACEACHGPAEPHVRANRTPLRRYRQHADDEGDDHADETIVQPARLDHRRATEVCGQCHSISMPLRAAESRGARFRAGDVLAHTSYVIRGSGQNLSETERERWAEATAMLDEIDPGLLRGSFWPDGMIRIAGREYNGLLETACFSEGTMSCLSCHSMHDSNPADQVAPGMDGDQACVQCHADPTYVTEAHTFHPPDSEGARCYNCHMPYTTYGLLGAVRSHQVDSPRVATSVATGRPNACNLCHLDQTLAWTAGHMESWYAQPPPPLDDDDHAIAASIRWTLSGDAAQRAIVAWSMGWAPARAASGDDWMGPALAPLLDDPYAAVRYVAARSLRTLPGLEEIAYDFVGPPDARRRAVEGALGRWRESASNRAPRPALLIGADGRLDVETLGRLWRARDDRPVEILE